MDNPDFQFISHTCTQTESRLSLCERINVSEYLVLEKNKFLVQDDTGVPFKKFDPSIWDIELFGKYEKPIKDFSQSLYQKELDYSYSNPKYYKGNLNFSLGYHWNSKNQNQMVFIKK